MKNKLISSIWILFLFFLFQINSKMTEEERNYLLNKLTKKISNTDEASVLKEKYYSTKLKDQIPYDPAKIEAIFEKYNLPSKYNYLEAESCPTVVKDQQRCGCCWSHAATTHLAYRYHKIGVEVDLSPQDALSCYLRDCDAGNYLIDAEMNLVKNGTVTEGCLPFSSGDGVSIEDCPTKCKDGSEFKKYYSQNAYITEDYYSEDTFYDIVALIMDQLTTNGPVVTGIDVYDDFMDWHYDPIKCRDDVYTYDGVSDYGGGHAIVIVGYGYLNSKYYWLIQNSWGEYACDHGFVKVEFGQIGVEQVAFSEPYFHKEISDPVVIPVSLKSFDEECTLEISTTASLSNWKNTLDLGFVNTFTRRPFNFQCSLVNVVDGPRSVCYFEYFNFFTDKGTYKFSYSGSLGDENVFSLDRSLSQKEFTYYGFDDIYPIFTFELYISQEGSKIVFLIYNDNDDFMTLPPIYANENSKTPLSGCKYVYLGGNDLVYCDIKQNEVDYFDDMSSYAFDPMLYDILCGYKLDIFAFVYKLDTTKYPVFKIKKFILPEDKTLSFFTAFTLEADIEGSLSGYTHQYNYVELFIEIEVDGQNLTSLVYCELEHPGILMKNYLFNCYLDVDPGKEITYDNVYLHPYNLPYINDDPFEVYIKDMIKGQPYNPSSSVPKIQVYIESLCPDCVNFITKSFKEFYEKVQKPNLVDIEFIPFGNAKETYNQNTKKYEFECQHKENECYGNLIETCTIQILGRKKSYETIICIESNIFDLDDDFDKTLELCLSNDKDALQEVKNCVSSDLGNYYEHQMAQKTGEHTWVPWIIVDGVHDVDVENKIIDNLIDYICGDDKTKCY